MKRNATAVWNGSLKEGAGKLTTQTTTLKDTQYSFKSRFEEGVGTNPEELIAAAHAGCYTMQLTAYLSEDGFKVESIESKCDIDLQEGTIVDAGTSITIFINKKVLPEPEKPEEPDKPNDQPENSNTTNTAGQ